MRISVEKKLVINRGAFMMVMDSLILSHNSYHSGHRCPYPNN